MDSTTTTKTGTPDRLVEAGNLYIGDTIYCADTDTIEIVEDAQWAQAPRGERQDGMTLVLSVTGLRWAWMSDRYERIARADQAVSLYRDRA